MLWPKTYLHMYNTGKGMATDSTLFKRIIRKIPATRTVYDKTANWLQTGIGEPPVIVDTTQLNEDVANLRNVCFSNGYFYPNISYSIDTIDNWYHKQKAKVTFQVEEQQAYVIQQTAYTWDSTASPEILADFQAAFDTSASLLVKDALYNHTLFNQERSRAALALRNKGYFTFSPSFISFLVDTTKNEVAENLVQRPLAVTTNVSKIGRPYRIGKLLVNLRANSDKQDQTENFTVELTAASLTDSLRQQLKIKDKQFSSTNPYTYRVTSTIIRDVNFNFLADRIYFQEDSLYSFDKALLTQKKLQELGMFQYLIINYVPIDSLGILDVNINLELAPHYQMKVGAEAFTTSTFVANNLPVVGANISFQNRNTFGKSELLSANLGGSVGFYGSALESNQFQRIFYEVVGGLDLNIPRFLAPDFLQRNVRIQNPSTLVAGSFRGEILFEYDRYATGLNLNYRWEHAKSDKKMLITSQLSPLNIDFIFIENINDNFQDDIDRLPPTLQRDYQSRFSSRISYTYTRANYRLTRTKPTWSFRFNVEAGGNIPWILENLLDSDQEEGDNYLSIFRSQSRGNSEGLAYGQFLKGSVEGKLFVPLNSKSELVFRGFFGYGSAYNTTQIIPQESRFYSGGTNSMRGWQSNTLGPGRLSLRDIQTENFTSGSSISLLAPGGEIISEMNAELRFDVYSYLEMALFTDVGNVWFGNTPTNLGGDRASLATFSSDNLSLGWDAGLGFRFDFSFLILRVDLAQQLHAPDVGWVLNKSNDPDRRFQLNLGIGYPF